MESKEPIKLMDYAESSGISIQALGKKLSRYRKELEGHIITEGRARYLDSFAVEFLDGKRDRHPVSVVVKDTSKEVKELTDKNTELLEKLNTAYEALLTEKQKYTMLLEEHTALQLSIAQKNEEPKAPEQEEESKNGNRFVRAWKELWK